MNYFINKLTFINLYSGAINAFLSLILVLTTIYYAYVTYKLRTDAVKKDRLSMLPYIQLECVPSGENGMRPKFKFYATLSIDSYLNFKLSNVGLGTAINIRVLIVNGKELKYSSNSTTLSLQSNKTDYLSIYLSPIPLKCKIRILFSDLQQNYYYQDYSLTLTENEYYDYHSTSLTETSPTYLKDNPYSKKST